MPGHGMGGKPFIGVFGDNGVRFGGGLGIWDRTNAACQSGISGLWQIVMLCSGREGAVSLCC